MARVALCMLVPLALAGSARGGALGCRALAVVVGAVPYPHATSVQRAVAEARPCDWILIARGVYRGPVTIRTPGLVVRGLDRNAVVIDGAHTAGNGITVDADNVSIENLTVRNFDRRFQNDDATGTEVLWRRVRDWRGSYVTAYDDGLRGGYGLWASGSERGTLADVYASGFSDSGLYVGACRDCRAVVEHATAEHNLIGLAATNAGGHFLVERSVFRGNTVGISLNSSRSDPPPPQFGSCASGANRSPAPRVTTTRFARCTIVRDNRVVANNALEVPSETASVRPGAGIGIDLLGAYGDLIAGNAIIRNTNIGVLGLQLPERARPRFALSGNRISDNRISGSRLAVALAGGSNNCFQSNGPGATLPADRARYACANAATPAIPARTGASVLALVSRLHGQLAAQRHRAQRPPAAQPTMPAPCAGAPSTPLCRR